MAVLKEVIGVKACSGFRKVLLLARRDPVLLDTPSGILQDNQGEAVMFSNIVLYQAADSSVAKVETSDEIGQFKISL